MKRPGGNGAGRVAIWAITDGRAGHAAQARALAEAVARRAGASVEEKTLRPRAPLDRLPPALWAAFGAREGGWPFRGLAEGAEALRPPWPALAIGCGGRSAPIVAAIRRLGGGRAVQILGPGMGAAAFDLVVVPAHDRLRAPNLVETLGALNALSPEVAAAEAERWRRRLGHLPEPRVAVLVGGPSRSARFGPRALDALTQALTRLAVDGAGLMVTPSPRTPPAVVERLADLLSGLGGWLWGGAGDNPYPAVLGLAEAALVTADSVNMASEAATLGLPVHVLPVDRLDPKLARFHAALEAYGAARPFAGELGRWAYAPLAETERVAEAVAALLPDGSDAWPEARRSLSDGR